MTRPRRLPAAQSLRRRAAGGRPLDSFRSFNIMFAKIFLIVCAVTIRVESKYLLKQVVILSRHNIRTPLSKNLAELTPKPWPEWKEKYGHLTAKGAHLEGFMGSYFAAWLREEKLLLGTCPTEDMFYAYANVKQRTKRSAIAFVDKAFPDCNVKVHYKEESDPVFNPVIHNHTEHFIDVALKEMNTRLQRLSLNNSLLFIENILDYKESKRCRRTKQCELRAGADSIHAAVGYKPNITGPLKIGKSVIDSFVMSYYQGFPLEDVGWGLIDDEGQWELIMEISKGYHDVIFNSSIVAKDIAAPLINYMAEIFMNREATPKVTLIMGHDANLLTVLSTMDFSAYTLQQQFEKCPVGGKIVFQKWFDDRSEENFLKINYVYSSAEQLRYGLELSLERPPRSALLELNSCKLDANGFCPWNDFILFLKSLL